MKHDYLKWMEDVYNVACFYLINSPSIRTSRVRMQQRGTGSCHSKSDIRPQGNTQLHRNNKHNLLKSAGKQYRTSNSFVLFSFLWRQAHWQCPGLTPGSGITLHTAQKTIWVAREQSRVGSVLGKCLASCTMSPPHSVLSILLANCKTLNKLLYKLYSISKSALLFQISEELGYFSSKPFT